MAIPEREIVRDRNDIPRPLATEALPLKLGRVLCGNFNDLSDANPAILANS